MKNIILIIGLSLVFTNCKKKQVSTSVIAYCIWYNQTCVGCQTRVFYKCTDNKDEMTKTCLSLRDQGLFYEVIEKSNCSECQ